MDGYRFRHFYCVMMYSRREDGRRVEGLRDEKSGSWMDGGVQRWTSVGLWWEDRRDLTLRAVVFEWFLDLMKQ